MSTYSEQFHYQISTHEPLPCRDSRTSAEIWYFLSTFQLFLLSLSPLQYKFHETRNLCFFPHWAANTIHSPHRAGAQQMLFGWMNKDVNDWLCGCVRPWAGLSKGFGYIKKEREFQFRVTAENLSSWRPGWYQNCISRARYQQVKGEIKERGEGGGRQIVVQIERRVRMC